MHTNPILSLASAILLLAWCGPASGGDAPLRVCATVPELGDLVHQVGGDLVAVTVFAKPDEDPHVIEARPSFVKQLAEADLFIEAGLELEIGWAPVLLKNARNAQVLPGAPGFLDIGAAITPLAVPSGPVDRSQGDVHAAGNPHYLTDPLSAFRATSAIRDRLAALRPEQAAAFAQACAAFQRRLGQRLFGDELAAKYAPAKLAMLVERGGLDAFLQAQGDAGRLGGWLGLMKPFAGRAVVADHDLWPYFARTFGVVVAGFLEPKPGIPPTSKHLAALIAQMERQHITAIITVPYFDPRHARFVAEQTGARIALLAHQAGALPGTSDYLEFVDHDVHALAEALGGVAVKP